MMTFCKVAKNLEEQRFIWYKGQTFLMTTTVKAKKPPGVVASSVCVPGSSKLEAVLWLSILKSDPILYKAKCLHIDFTPATCMRSVSQYSWSCMHILAWFSDTEKDKWGLHPVVIAVNRSLQFTCLKSESF